MLRTAACLTVSATVVLVLGCSPSAPSGTAVGKEPSFTIVPATDSVKVGQAVVFDLSEHWPAGVTPPPTWHYWSIDNPDVASIDARFDVRVRGKSPGQVRLTGCLDSEFRSRCDSRLLTVTP